MSMSPEPMSLGSPTQSPGGHSQTPQPYLPQFLLGDMNNSGLGASPLHLPHHLGGGRQPTPQQQQQQQHHGNNYFLNHHQQPYGPGSGGSGGYGGGSQKYWHNPGSNSNSPPRSGSGSNFLLPSSAHHHHHHHHSSLIQAPGLGRTYSMNAHDYGHMRAGSIGGTGAADMKQDANNLSGYGVPGGATSTSYSPSPLQSQAGATPSSGQQAPGAPPLNRLVDIMNAKQPSSAASPGSGSSMCGGEPLLSPYMPSSGGPTGASSSGPYRLLNSPPSPTQIDPFYTHGNDSMQPLDDTWVTIFGHPPSATSYVLQEFATYGQIVRYVPPSQTEQGNWLHVKYQTRMQAQKALSKNGKILGGQFMVGVMACIDRKIMFGASGAPAPGGSLGAPAGSNEENTEPQSIGGGAAPSKPNFASRSAAKLDRTQSLRTNARPLSMINRAATTAHDDSSIDGSAKLPKKNTNVISKAMEFMFGW